MTHSNTKELGQNLPMQYNYAVQEEEISLVDLWLTIRRYKKRFMLVFCFALMIGLSYVYYFYEEAYSLVSTIQIGTMEKDNSILPIESPESLLSKITDSMVPSHMNKWVQDNSVDEIFETTSSNPTDTNIIMITNKSTKENIGKLSGYQKGLVQLVIDDHKYMINPLRSRVESALRQAQLELDKLKNPLSLKHKMKEAKIELDGEKIKLKKLENERYLAIQKSEFQADIVQAKHEKNQLDDLVKGRLEQYKRIEESKKILLEKINEFKAQVSSAKSNLMAAANSATEQTALSQLLIGNDIQQNQNQLAVLEERYYVGLENEKTDLMHEIESIRLKKIELQNKIELLGEKYNVMLEDNQTLLGQQRLKVDEVEVKLEQIEFQHEISTTMQEEKVRELKTRLDNFNETRAVSTAVPSLKPVGTSRLKLVSLAFIGAGMLGFAAVLLAIFGDKVKERLEEKAVV